ncbi:unnamed protein product [Trichogramma brassicae]|uniref:Uncharacterized protein n=1 Tax=Trichogramma brassicae TaxID=86971 RepID=A0A6H5ILF3_9HYME|nr:unnamed protein product [Trichogramma brassicae]
MIRAITTCLCFGAALGQFHHPSTTPVPILKQINRHNEDGSYSYGFEAADGSYKIESKYPSGEVYGKYGFIDDTGSLREIEYGATKQGFQPQGTGINVPPPPVVADNHLDKDDPEDDGQYREDPNVYHTDPRFTNGERYDPVPNHKYPTIQNHQLHRHQPGPSPAPHVYGPIPSKIAHAYRQPIPVAPVPAPAPAPHHYSQPEYQPQYKTHYQHQYPSPATYYQPQYAPVPHSYNHHPSSLGSYRQYKR